MRTSGLLSLIAGAVSVAAQYKGFNYGSTNSDGSFKSQDDFTKEFNTAKGLVGASGFSSARLFTMIQGGTTDTVTSAIPAAVSSKTSLLLGLWGSGGPDVFTNEVNALTTAINQFGDDFVKLVVGISVGSEDLYRISPTGIINNSGAGAAPSDIVNYINQLRSAIKSTALSKAPVGHVDTWTAWVNSSNNAVAGACDFVGMDAYPYFQSTMANGIDTGASLFQSAYQQTVNAVGGKPVWVTETGWPVSGSTSNQAVPNLQNAKTYWDQVGCGQLFGKVNTWWFTLQDANPVTPNPSFGIVGSTLSTTPLFDLSCSSSGGSGGSGSSSSSSSSSGSGSGSTSSSGPTSSSGSGSGPTSSSGPSSSYTSSGSPPSSSASGSSYTSSPPSSSSAPGSGPGSSYPTSSSGPASSSYGSGPSSSYGSGPSSSAQITTYAGTPPPYSSYGPSSYPGGISTGGISTYVPSNTSVPTTYSPGGSAAPSTVSSAGAYLPTAHALLAALVPLAMAGL